MKIRSVLLGTAALFVTGVAANAADAPASKMESACEFGDSYFAIGGGNCLDISGRARFEYKVNVPHDEAFTGWADGETDRTDFEKEVDLSDLSANARVDLTVMSATDMGPLKGFIRIEDTISKAYVSWNGITAGKTDSFFGFSSGLGEDEASHATGTWDSAVPLLAYTFDAGNGITATVSAEKRSAGYVAAGALNSTNVAEPNGFGRDVGVATINSITVVEGLITEVDTGTTGDNVAWNATTYKLPDFVADIEVTQDWGSAGVSAAITGVTIVDPTKDTDSIEETGYAVAGGVKVNVPGAEGLALTARGTYGVGAINYVKGLQFGTDADGNAQLAAAYLEANSHDSDIATTEATSYSLELVTAWDVGAGVSMDISDTMSANIAVSYAQIDQEQAEKLTGTGAASDNTAGTFTTALDSALYASGTLYWTPVSDLTIGLEAFYGQDSYNHYGKALITDTKVTTKESSQANMGGSLTITRSF